MPTVMVTYVWAPYVLATFVHISIILAVTDPILIELFGPNFLGAFIIVDHFFFYQTKVIIVWVPFVQAIFVLGTSVHFHQIF